MKRPRKEGFWRALWLRMRYRRNDARRYGARPDGRDCTSAIERAIGACKPGQTVRLGPGPLTVLGYLDGAGKTLVR